MRIQAIVHVTHVQIDEFDGARPHIQMLVSDYPERLRSLYPFP